jgi:Tfp pilus assembly protein PilN
MKTRINLYRDEFKPQFVWVSATNSIVFGVIALLVMGAIFFGIWQDQNSREQELAEIKSSIEAKKSKLDEVTKQLTQRKKDPALLNQLSTQQVRLSTAKHLADKLESLSKLQENSFSSALTSFAEINNSSVWLTQFKVNDTEIVIEGNINKPGALPTWLKSIGKTKFFENRKFSAATVYRTEEQLSFRIQSKTAKAQTMQGETNE